MKLIIGLGNPGEKYQENRHNVGHLFIDFIDEKVSSSNSIKTMKTGCFMNDSGRWVAEKVNFFKIPTGDLIVVHDDLDIPLGQFKIQLGVGPKIHYGINSIEDVMGTKDFWRVRIGVDSRLPESRTEGERYVLEDFSKEEMEKLKAIFPEIWEKLETVVN